MFSKACFRAAPSTRFEPWRSRAFRRASSSLTHVDEAGKASMVDVSGKSPSLRCAVAAGRVLLSRAAFSLVASNSLAKGDVLTVAKLAGVMGAKRAAGLIPLCHPVPLTHVDVRLRLVEEVPAVDIVAEARVAGVTGVEMEALTAVSVAALTVYDMCKAVDKSIVISDVKLVRKSGGKSGDWRREDVS